MAASFKILEMWFALGFQNLIAKNHLSDDFYDVFVSDFKRIWHKSLSDNDLLSICQSLNPLFEASVQKLRDVIIKSLKDVTVQKEIKGESSDILLKLESNIMGVRFQFQVLLDQGDDEMLYKELTIPLLLLLMNAQNRENKLIEIIKNKDEEIKDFRQEYGIISSCFSTKPFNKKEFDFQESASSMPWDPASFLDCINAKLLSIKAVFGAKSDKLLVEKSDKEVSENKNDVVKSYYKDKNVNHNRRGEPHILLDNKIIKKVKKNNNVGFKIKI